MNPIYRMIGQILSLPFLCRVKGTYGSGVAAAQWNLLLKPMELISLYGRDLLPGLEETSNHSSSKNFSFYGWGN